MPIFERACVVPCSAAALFRYHAAAGAFARLTPPFDPATVVVPLAALQNGERAEIDVGLGPLTTRWIARHQDVDDGSSGGAAGFVDVMERGPFRAWRHEHLFEPLPTLEGVQRCRLVDRITFQGPLLGVGDSFVRRKLERMFRFRHDTTRADMALMNALTASSASLVASGRRLRVGMTGSSGLLGTELRALLSVAGHDVVPLLRPGRGDVDGALSWDPATGAVTPVERASDLDAVVHLAGEGIAEGRLDDDKKRRIREQRVEGTQRLLDGLRALPVPPRVVVSAAAVGFYGDRGDDVVDEDSPAGSGFLAELCADWERAVLGRVDPWRAVVLRIGIAQSPLGGALRSLLPVFRAGLGGPLGDGSAFFPAVAVDDVAAVFLRVLLDPRARGIVNAVGVEAERNRAYAHTLGRVLGRPAVVPVPAVALRIAVGELAEFLLESQRVAPSRLRALGHAWRHETLEDGLRHQLGRWPEDSG